VDIKEMESKGVDWINVTEDRYQGQAVVNMVINFQLP
jgi:hypothetical protein